MPRKTFIKLDRPFATQPIHREKMGCAVWLYLYLLDRVNWDTGVVSDWRDQDAADDLDLSPRTIRKYRKILEEHGYLVTHQRQYSLALELLCFQNPRYPTQGQPDEEPAFLSPATTGDTPNTPSCSLAPEKPEPGQAAPVGDSMKIGTNSGTDGVMEGGTNSDTNGGTDGGTDGDMEGGITVPSLKKKRFTESQITDSEGPLFFSPKPSPVSLPEPPPKKAARQNAITAPDQTSLSPELNPLAIYREVTGRPPPQSQVELVTTIITAHQFTVEDLRPYWYEWSVVRGYHPKNLNWLTSWAVQGQIPHQSLSASPREVRPPSPGKASQPRGLAAVRAVHHRRKAKPHGNP